MRFPCLAVTGACIGQRCPDPVFSTTTHAKKVIGFWNVVKPSRGAKACVWLGWLKVLLGWLCFALLWYWAKVKLWKRLGWSDLFTPQMEVDIDDDVQWTAWVSVVFWHEAWSAAEIAQCSLCSGERIWSVRASEGSSPSRSNTYILFLHAPRLTLKVKLRANSVSRLDFVS